MLLHSTIGLPLYDFPSTLILVDDNPMFTNVFCEKLRLDLIEDVGIEGYFNVKIFSHAKEAFEFLKALSLQQSVSSDIGAWKRVESAEGEGAVQVDFLCMKNVMYDQRRYQWVTTVILDEYMPELNGAQLCARIKGKSTTDNLNLPYSVLMLTGYADDEFGLSVMMNQGADGFFHKGDNQHIQQLKNMMITLKRKMLFEQSQKWLENIFMSTRGNTLLTNPIFVEFFKKMRLKHRAIEYVVIDAYGSAFFQTLEGEKSVLVIAHEGQLQDLHSRLECYDHPERINDISQAIYSRTKIPFFFTEEEAGLPLEKWRSYLHPAIPLEGLSGYYYAYITDLSTYDIQAERIVHYQKD